MEQVVLKLKSEQFYIYGGSHFGQALNTYLCQIGLKPKAILDRCPKASHFDRTPCITFPALKIEKKLPILVTILGFDGVYESLNDYGFEEIIETLDVFSAFPKALEILNECGVLWMQAPREYQVDQVKCAQLQSLWADRHSKETFDKIVNYRTTPCALYYPHPQRYEMYFPPDIPKLYDYLDLRVLDVGAFDGDTLDGFARRFKDKVSDYVAIEVSEKNIQKLNERLLSNFGVPVKVIRTAVGVPKGCSLKVVEMESATVVELVDDKDSEEGSFVQSSNLGDLLHRFQSNILKMDIEGADFAAIKQASDYIAKHLPTLALSLYHCPKDLWEIPLYIESIAPNTYNFYLRQEGHWLLETQFYAVPKFL
ncbi:hypothetical protein PALB_5920 [Pseudoalteromonas luteoviolacea B = ATCC 29581]|nr:hypothetical protein PALB_5920 [Pseudoalteromonas luteoviolacea B = ATCC 29581]